MTALATKTVIFVTHQVEFLPAADMILVWDCPIFILYGVRVLEYIYSMFMCTRTFMYCSLCLDVIELLNKNETCSQSWMESHYIFYHE